jgi:hypothetical protein
VDPDFFFLFLRMEQSDEEKSPPRKRPRGRPPKSMRDLFELPCPDGMWLFSPHEDLAIFVCRCCYTGHTPMENLELDVHGRLVEPPGELYGKMNAHVRLKSHIVNREKAQRSSQSTIESSFESRAEVQRQAVQYLLDLSRFVLVTGNSFQLGIRCSCFRLSCQI